MLIVSVAMEFAAFYDPKYTQDLYHTVVALESIDVETYMWKVPMDDMLVY